MRTVVPFDVRRDLRLRIRLQYDALCRIDARSLLHASLVEQWNIVPSILQPSLRHPQHHSVVYQKLVPEYRVCALAADEELMIKREVSEFKAESTHSFVL